MGARTYDPLMEFSTPYSYVGGNPVNLTDPTGMSSECANRGHRGIEDLEAYLVECGSQTALTHKTDPRKELTREKDKGEIEGTQAQSQEKSELAEIDEARASIGEMGVLGAAIRSQLESNFAKDLFEHFWMDLGNATLNDEQFSKIVQEALFGDGRFRDTEGKDINVYTPWGSVTFGKVYSVSFYKSSEYGLAFGTANLYFDLQGNPIGFRDYYDFDHQPAGQRSTSAEGKTRAVAKASEIANRGTPYSITYGFAPKLIF